MNLHAIAVNCIKQVHNTEICTIYQSNGQQNVKGVMTPSYGTPFTAEVDVQPMSPRDLQTFQQIRDVKVDWQCFLNTSTSNPIAGVTRYPLARTGDFIKRANGRWLLVTCVMGDWQDDGWCSVGAVEQLEAPDVESTT